jgi:hypothetical protein
MEAKALRAARALPAGSKDNEHVPYRIAIRSGAVVARDMVAPAIPRLQAFQGLCRTRAGLAPKPHRVGTETAASGDTRLLELSRSHICWRTIIDRCSDGP